MTIGPEAQFRFENYLTPTTLYADAGDIIPSRSSRCRRVSMRRGWSPSNSRRHRKTARKIPYFVTRPKDPAGPAPTVLYGYGGFEVSLTPAYSANFGRLWLTKGGIYVVANIRGGGEFGPGLASGGAEDEPPEGL